MSADSPPPPSPVDDIQSWLTKAETLIALIVENFRRGTWVKRLLLLDALVLFALNARVVNAGLRTFAVLGEDESLPNWYGKAFWATVGLLFLAALLVALFTPATAKVEMLDLSERKAIKGLRPFTTNDAEIFTRLQRNRSLRDCLEAITSDSFRFGILMGESGCGKTSFLQAGLLPKLSDPEAEYRAVYVRFSDRLPLNAIRDDLVKQLHIPKEQLDSADLVVLLQTAAAAIAKPLILFFDQFEQFFVHAPRKPDRQPFIQALTDWYHSDLPVRVLVCMRGDMCDRLVELHQALGYALSPQEVFRLEKFSPEEATKVLQVIAETEKLRFEESFVRELAERELADREDGAISPVDLQILGWMIERQNADELRAFNQQAFQKFGGVEGLMTRFLEKTLEARVIKAQREAAVKVLLALTDLDRNVRAGALSLTEIQEKLKDTVKADEVAEAVRWLVRGDVRLITPEEKAEETVYELAHERLIPAVRKVAGKELTEAQRANELLDRRVNEWLRNNRHSRYLFNLQEFWLLKKHKLFLNWNTNRQEKERLLRRSKQQIYRITSGILIVIVLTVLLGKEALWFYFPNFKQREVADARALALTSTAWTYHELGQPRQAINLLQQSVQNANQIEDLSTRAKALEAIIKVTVMFEKSQQIDDLLEQLVQSANQIEDPYFKALTLESTIEITNKFGRTQQSIGLLQQSLQSIDQIKNSKLKALALSAIARSTAKLEPQQAVNLLEQVLNRVDQIKNSDEKANILGVLVVETYNFKQSQPAIEILQKANRSINKIEDPSSKLSMLMAVASQYDILGQSQCATEVLQQALQIVNQIDDMGRKASALGSIAEMYNDLQQTERANEVLQQARQAVDGIGNPP